ncbi:hypothetical protein VPH35_093942 [Triticum aestivum]
MGAAVDETAAAAAAAAVAAEGGAAAAAAEADSKDLQQQSKALDKLTDHVEDRQLDSSRVQSAMAALASSKEADWNAMRLREKELAAVKINPTDVEIIANELEVASETMACTYFFLPVNALNNAPSKASLNVQLDKKIAERTLREHKGDAVAAVRFLLR